MPVLDQGETLPAQRMVRVGDPEKRVRIVRIGCI
jgi:hypothetical protein